MKYSRFVLTWSVVLCVTTDSQALQCYEGNKLESCSGACMTIKEPDRGQSKGEIIGTGCVYGERVPTYGCSDVQNYRRGRADWLTEDNGTLETLGTACLYGKSKCRDIQTRVEGSLKEGNGSILNQNALQVKSTRVKRGLSDDQVRDAYNAMISHRLNLREGQVCYCQTNGCNGGLGFTPRKAVLLGVNGGSGFKPSMAVLLGVLCVLGWQSFSE